MPDALTGCRLRAGATLDLGPERELRAIRLLRWSNLTPDGRSVWVPYSAPVEAERTFGGYTIPSAVTAAWHLSSDVGFDFFTGQGRASAPLR